MARASRGAYNASPHRRRLRAIGRPTGDCKSGMNKPAGKVYFVDAGPGDPELVPLRALRRLGEADVVFHDTLVHPDVLLYCRDDAELRRVETGDQTPGGQGNTVQRLLEAARSGLMVARLRCAQSLATAQDLADAEYLARAGIAFEVIPGVAATSAAMAYAGVSPTHGQPPASVICLAATGSAERDERAHDWSKLATASQALAILSTAPALGSLMRLLIRHGRPAHTPVVVIHKASLPSQRRVIGSLSDIAARVARAKLASPTITLVGDLVAAKPGLDWYSRLPLFSQRVLVTRPAHQSGALAQALRDQGALPVILPAVRLLPPSDRGPLAAAVGNLARYDVLAVTSANGVRALFAELERQGGDARRLSRCQIAAIGPATAATLREYGVRADVVPPEHRGEALAQALIERHAGNLRAKRILLARAAVAREALPQLLRAAGGLVDAVEAYRAQPPDAEQVSELRRLLRGGSIDVVTFTASSAVRNVMAALGDAGASELSSSTVACIGPITAETARDFGIKVDVSAQPYTTQGLVASLCSFMAERAPVVLE
ncbi:MAG: uroporphyrinogen-III synthase [Proteobacteria bacterium]|nr:uroporphyrinogen-III synthase [Pseudomonadota bacterium]